MDARDEITRLVNRYCYLIDAGDFAEFADLYAQAELVVEGDEWAQANAPTAAQRGRDEVLENTRSSLVIYDDGTTRTRHLNSNVDIEIDELNDTAECQRYVTVLQQTDELPLQVIYSAHYFDSFVKENGGWRFARTIIRRPFFGNMTGHGKFE